MEPGLYVTFFSKDEPASRELPPVGPLDNVVLRQHGLLAERRSVQQAQELGVAIDRWLEAELEFQRATGEEPGGSKRIERRFTSGDGVYVRFAVFGDPREHDLVPELGPFAVVVLRSGSLEADGRTLATRISSEIAVWELANEAGAENAGLHKPDIALRTANTSYHPSITPTIARTRVTENVWPVTPPPFELPPLEMPSTERAATPWPVTAAAALTEQLFTDRPKRPVETSSAAPTPLGAEAPLTNDDRAMIDQLDRDRRDETLRARIQLEERKRLGVGENPGASGTSFAMRYRNQSANDEGTDAQEGEAGRQWGPALWRMRFAIVGVLLVLAGVYIFATLRGGIGFGPSAAQPRYVGLTQRVTGGHWEYTVNAVQSSPQSGSAAASGTFYIVRLAVTNTSGEGQQLSPSSFTLIDAYGGRHGAEGTNSGVYAPGSGIIWPASFPMRQVVSAPIVFDIDPSLPRGMMLSIDELPDLRIRLD
jgi:hypothetical protein